MAKRMKPTLESFGPLLITKDDFANMHTNGAHATDIQLEDLQSQGWVVEPTERKLEFREHWTEWMAFREFIQNSLDAAQNFALEYDENSKISYIVDDGPGFGPEAMLLGSEKAKNEKDLHCLRGVYGEGMKVAFQPFLKANKRILIRTRGSDYTFLVTNFRGTATQVLVKLSRPNNMTQGTCVAIENFDCRAFAENIVQCLPEDDIMLTITGGDKQYDGCKIRQILSRPGDIYFRDIFVNNMNTGDPEQKKIYLFGYNFWFDKTVDFLGPDRTKFAPDSSALGKEVTYLIRALPSPQGREFATQLMQRWKMAIDSGIDAYNIFESRFIDAYAEGLEGHASDIEALKVMDEAIKAAFDVKEYSGVVGYEHEQQDSQRKSLEHLGVTNLEHYLPRSLIEKMSQHKIVKSGKEWQGLEDLQTVTALDKETVSAAVDDFLTMSVDEFDDIMAKGEIDQPKGWSRSAPKKEVEAEEEPTGDAGTVSFTLRKIPPVDRKPPPSMDTRKWKSHIEIAYSYLLTQLRNLANQAAPGVNVQIFDRDKKVKTTEIDKIGGFFDGHTIWLKLTSLLTLDRLLRVFIHELGHAMCSKAENPTGRENRCSDLEDDFEAYLVRAGIFMFDKQREIKDIEKRLAVLNQNGFMFFLCKRIWKVSEEPKSGDIKKTVEREKVKALMITAITQLRQKSPDISSFMGKLFSAPVGESGMEGLEPDGLREAAKAVNEIKVRMFADPTPGPTGLELAYGYKFKYGTFTLSRESDGKFGLEFAAIKRQAWMGRLWVQIYKSAKENVIWAEQRYR